MSKAYPLIHYLYPILAFSMLFSYSILPTLLKEILSAVSRTLVGFSIQQLQLFFDSFIEPSQESKDL